MRDGRLFGQFLLLASPSKTVISRAKPLALFYFRAFDCQPSRALWREKKSRRCDEWSGFISVRLARVLGAPQRE
ncbi:MAG TPA: hypothetical protein VGM44_16320 [Polyangiaceae bacterium]